jgi:mannose-6-phosphate isomerase-like protein (cupin superfamily)
MSSFSGVSGRFRIEFRDQALEVGPGEFVIVPHGVEAPYVGR